MRQKPKGEGMEGLDESDALARLTEELNFKNVLRSRDSNNSKIGIFAMEILLKKADPVDPPSSEVYYAALKNKIMEKILR